eukprot:jgi/Bigna1/81004/fgenesh1_pg.76_\
MLLGEIILPVLVLALFALALLLTTGIDCNCVSSSAGHTPSPEDVLIFDKFFGGAVVDSVVNVETDPREEEDDGVSALSLPPLPPADRMSPSDAAAIFLSPYLSNDDSTDGDEQGSMAPTHTSPPSLSPPSPVPRLSLDDVIAGRQEPSPPSSEEDDCTSNGDDDALTPSRADELRSKQQQGEQQRMLEAEKEFLQRENIVLKAMVKKLRIRVFDLEVGQ